MKKGGIKAEIIITIHLVINILAGSQTIMITNNTNIRHLKTHQQLSLPLKLFSQAKIRLVTKWLDKATGEIFSYDWNVSEFDGTRLNAEFVAFLKEGD